MEDLYQRVIPINIEDEMKRSYMDYAMSVIIGRAIPDVRDGLKPVHRRVLYSMYEMGNRWNRPYKKSARIVGDIIGKYHPHGDAAVYDTIVRMAQDFNMRYPLIDGQGNFGSVDGDPPAAMRYTEIRMARISEEVLVDIEKDTVDFVPNYDASLMEPTILPTRVPLLLLNGSSGIAVGVATNIPPHNIKEIIDGTIALIKNPDLTVKDLMKYIPGPDFPTAGFINGTEGIASAYETGRGVIKLRARAVVERNQRSDRENIVITELPYQVNKAALIERISELVKERKIEGIADLRDESDRDGIRVVIDLKKDEVASVVLNQLYKHTQMETSFGVIMLAIEGNQPRLFNLKEILTSFIEFRKQIVCRRTRFELQKAEERLHLLEGLLVAIRNIDGIVSLIKKSKDPQDALSVLCDRYNLTEAQSKAILDMRLQRLTNLERDKVLEEHNQLIKTVQDLRSVLADPQRISEIVVKELENIKEHYGDERRTEIIPSAEDINVEDLIAEEEVVVTVSHYGYVKRTPLSLYRIQRRGGRGKVAVGIREDDFVEKVFITSTHDYVLVFTNSGRVYWLKVYQIPEAGRSSRGKAIVNILNLSSEERVVSILPVKEFTSDCYVMMATKKGIVKKTVLSAFSNPRSAGIIAVNVEEGDELIGVQLTTGGNAVFLGTRAGMAIRFSEGEVRDMGRVARGVRGITLTRDDSVVAIEIPDERNTILTVTDKGFGKRTPVVEYRLQGRGGKGIINFRTGTKVGNVSAICEVSGDEEVILVSDRGKLMRVRVDEIPVIHRATRGVKLIDLEIDEKLVSVARVEKDGERLEENGEGKS
ncbi:MAG: DNA gyrase subunit A [Syntrophales bacterium]|nr:DNA gyrase subunit A [Syntrophales bacterium]